MKVCSEINKKLSSRWNPFKAANSKRRYAKLSDVITLHRRIKQKELRYDTFRTYDSQLKLFSDWLEEMKIS